MTRERDAANNGRDVSQDALARMAIRNTQMKVYVMLCYASVLGGGGGVVLVLPDLNFTSAGVTGVTYGRLFC